MNIFDVMNSYGNVGDPLTGTVTSTENSKITGFTLNLPDQRVKLNSLGGDSISVGLRNISISGPIRRFREAEPLPPKITIKKEMLRQSFLTAAKSRQPIPSMNYCIVAWRRGISAIHDGTGKCFVCGKSTESAKGRDRSMNLFDQETKRHELLRSTKTAKDRIKQITCNESCGCGVAES